MLDADVCLKSACLDLNSGLHLCETKSEVSQEMYWAAQVSQRQHGITRFQIKAACVD